MVATDTARYAEIFEARDSHAGMSVRAKAGTFK
jgi:hypothetical protein